MSWSSLLCGEVISAAIRLYLYYQKNDSIIPFLFHYMFDYNRFFLNKLESPAKQLLFINSQEDKDDILQDSSDNQEYSMQSISNDVTQYYSDVTSLQSCLLIYTVHYAVCLQALFYAFNKCEPMEFEPNVCEPKGTGSEIIFCYFRISPTDKSVTYPCAVFYCFTVFNY